MSSLTTFPSHWAFQQAKPPIKYPNAIPKIYAIPCVPNCIYMQKGTCPIKKKIIDQTEANINE